VQGPPGAGKSTLVASYIAARRLRALWYHVDEGDRDPATFFYYLGLAAAPLLGKRGAALPLLTPEFLGNLPVFRGATSRRCSRGCPSRRCSRLTISKTSTARRRCTA
jgi:hypothetical protein